MKPLGSLVFCLGMTVWATGTEAGTAPAAFSVSITLRPIVSNAGPTDTILSDVTSARLAAMVRRGSTCTSQSSSDAGNATVTVVCSIGQFVSIEPVPGTPFPGSYEAASRVNFGPENPLLTGLASEMNVSIGSGTLTALRMTTKEELGSPIEMLVSF
jgi:hypothetical protein